MVRALTGEGRGPVEVEGGTVTLDIGDAVETLKQDLVKAGLEPAEKIPEVDKQMVLFQSDKLAKIRGAVHLLDVLGNWLPVLTVVLGTIGVLVARRRRRALVTTVLCAAAACLILAIGLAVARRYYLDHLPEQVQSPAAAVAIFDTLVRFLRVSLRTAMVLGIVVALGAWLSGAGRLPRGVRGTAERAADSAAGWSAAHGVHTGRVGTWVQAHRRLLTAGVLLVLALVFALWNHPTVLTVLLLALILLAVLAVLALLAAGGRVGARTDGPGDGSLPPHPPGRPVRSRRHGVTECVEAAAGGARSGVEDVQDLPSDVPAIGFGPRSDAPVPNDGRPGMLQLICDLSL